MKLKPVVASVVMLGLVAPAFAAKSSVLSRQAVINQNNVVKTVCSKGWFDRITVGGRGSIIGAVGSHSPYGMFQKNNASTDLYVNNFNLIFDVNLNRWADVTLNLAYLGAPNPFHFVGGEFKRFFGDGFVGDRHIRHMVVMDEGYVTFKNLAKSPFYFKVGKMYVPFGEYKDPYVPYPVMSPAQALSQFNAVTAVVGLVSDFGLYVSAFGFRGETSPMGSTAWNIRNFGGKIGYYDTLDQFDAPRTHMNVSLSYIHNLWDSQMFTPNAAPQWMWFGGNVVGDSFKLNHPADWNGTSYDPRRSQIEPAGALAFHFDLAYKSLSMSANYVTAMTDMISDAINYVAKGANRSRFWGADVGVDYSFKTFERNSSLGVGIQFSGNGAWMGNNNAGITDWVRIIPRWRLLGEYKFNLLKNTDLSFIATHGKSYDFVSVNGRAASDPEIGSNKTVTAGILSLNVQF